MPSRITASALRVSVARLHLDLARTMARLYLGTELYGTHSDEVILCCAILIGQTERRPMTAAKLADYAGMPRPTVVRKLRALESRGMVVMVDNAATLSIDRVNHFIPPGTIRQALGAHIRSVEAELSKMDGDEIAATNRPS